MKYNNKSLDTLFKKGKNKLTEVRRSSRELGKNHTPIRNKDMPGQLLTLIERAQALTTTHFASSNKARYTARFEKERESCLDELFKMYGVMQNYISHGAFSEGRQSGMQAFTPRLEEHLIRSRSEAPPCGTYYRSKEARTKPITEGPLARVKGLECEIHGPRWESRRTFKLCSKVDGNTGGRSVMAIGSTGAYPKGTKFETYEVKMVSRNNRYMFPRGAGEWSYTVKRAVYKG